MKKENQFLISKLNNSTKIFDACGVYDKGGDAVPYPSTESNFGDAMTFLEWYGLVMMPGFGFIIVDNMTKDGKVKVADYVTLLDKLKAITGLGTFNETTTENDSQFKELLDCFNSGQSLAINGAALVFAASMLTLL